jgi:carbamoyltransferase
MKILGITAFGQNPAACLIIDGALIGFSHEERFNRLKGSHGLFPSHTINWLLSSNCLTISDIDTIAFSWDCKKYPKKASLELLKSKVQMSFNKFEHRKDQGPSNYYNLFEYLLDYSPKNVEEKIKSELRNFGHKGSMPKIEFVDHHLSHAYQSYYHSSFKESLVLVVDGSGEENSVSGYVAKDGNFKKILNYKVPYSLGWFYGGMTAYLGFFPNRDEGKLMGLAAYGEARSKNNIWVEKLNEVLKADENGFNLNPYFFKLGANNYHSRYTDNLVHFITGINKDLQPIGINEFTINAGTKQNRYLLEEYIDLAYAVQLKLEDALSSIVNRMVKETGIKRLCYSGGVAMNCKANKAIYDRCSLEDIFIHPASSDDGTAIGAAFYIASECGELKQQPLLHAQLGASFSNDAIEKLLKNCSIPYTKPDDVSSAAAKLLYEGNYLGWFNGPAEMGARALGGRSIIANPFSPDIKNKINSDVKYRENWRPYCPSMLDENKKDYVKENLKSPFMIIASTATELLKSSSPSVVHIDNTIRSQTVKRDVLPKWAHLIDEFKSFSGHPVILNTSFNVRGEPIVNSPYDAIRTFYSTGLDTLVLGDYLIRKRQ